jgi:sugar transferase (PEP-CTERM/EpsH1 system associated)
LRILIVTDSCPYPMFSGGKIRVYNLIKRIAEKHEVWLATFVHNAEEIQGLTQMEKICCEVIGVKINKIPRLNKLIGYLKYALRGIPFEYFYLDSEDFSRELRTLTEKVDFDILHMLPSGMGVYLDHLSLKPSCKCILGFFDVNSNQYNRISRIQRNPYWQIRNWLFAFMTRRWEPKITQQFDRCEVVSESDKKMLQQINPLVKIDVIPNGVDTHLFHPLPKSVGPPIMMFIGNLDYYPCRDAMLYFTKEIFPIIRNTLPNAELLIVGVNPPPEIKKLESNAIHVTGQVLDIKPYYQQSTVCVVPLRAGGGTRLKILEAMALGRPVISTSIGFEGLKVIPDEDLLVGDSPELFAQKTISLLTNNNLYHKITSHAYDLVKETYDWDILARSLMDIYIESINS